MSSDQDDFLPLLPSPAVVVSFSCMATMFPYQRGNKSFVDDSEGDIFDQDIEEARKNNQYRPAEFVVDATDQEENEEDEDGADEAENDVGD